MERPKPIRTKADYAAAKAEIERLQQGKKFKNLRITVQEKIITGIILIVLFGIGHCIPIAVAGSSAALVERILDHGAFHHGSFWFRKLAGVVIALLGVYFIVRPFVERGAA